MLLHGEVSIFTDHSCRASIVSPLTRRQPARWFKNSLHRWNKLHTWQQVSFSTGNENVENDGANVFMLLREVALPLLCRDEPVSVLPSPGRCLSLICNESNHFPRSMSWMDIALNLHYFPADVATMLQGESAHEHDDFSTDPPAVLRLFHALSLCVV